MSPESDPPPAQTPPGPGVDATGQAVVDPTKNVETRVEREVVRLDDLAALRARNTEQVATIRSYYAEKLAELRAAHVDRLLSKEAERLDAIRAVDAAAAREESAAAETRAATLAKQVTDAAEVVRSNLDAARVAASESQAVALAPIQASIDSLRQTQYEQQGQRSQVAETRASGSNVVLWAGLAIAGAGLFFTFMLVILGVATFLLTR